MLSVSTPSFRALSSASNEDSAIAISVACCTSAVDVLAARSCSVGSRCSLESLKTLNRLSTSRRGPGDWTSFSAAATGDSSGMMNHKLSTASRSDLVTTSFVTIYAVKLPDGISTHMYCSTNHKQTRGPATRCACFVKTQFSKNMFKTDEHTTRASPSSLKQCEACIRLPTPFGCKDVLSVTRSGGGLSCRGRVRESSLDRESRFAPCREAVHRFCRVTSWM